MKTEGKPKCSYNYPAELQLSDHNGRTGRGQDGVIALLMCWDCCAQARTVSQGAERELSCL